MNTKIYRQSRLFVWPGNKRRCVIVVHGGKASSERTQEMGQGFASKFCPEFSVISVDYRFSGYGGLELEDVSHAIEYAYNQGFKKIYLIGESHGGYLVLLAASKIQVSGVVDAYGPTNLLTMQSYAIKDNPMLSVDWSDYIEATKQECHQSGLQLRECIEQRSPYYWADQIKDPVLILHGTQDDVVPLEQSLELVERFKSIGKTNYQLITFEGLSHGFSLLEGHPFEVLKDFLESY